MVGTSFRRRLMGVGRGEEPEPAPPGVVWYKRLIFDANTSLNTGVSVQGVTFEWEVEWTRIMNESMAYPFEKQNYDSVRDVRIAVSQYFGSVPFGYLLYGALTFTSVSASPALNTPNTFILSRQAGGSQYTLVSNGASGSIGGERDTGSPLYMNSGVKEVRKSIIRINGTEIQHLRPCTYYGEPGMWDTINEVFIGNASQSGSFSVAN